MSDDDGVGHPEPASKSACGSVFAKVAEAKELNLAVFFTIIVAAVVVGLQTNSDWSSSPVLKALTAVAIWIFTLEAILKILACWPRVWRYLLDPWNIFDLTIVVVGLAQFFANAEAGATVVVVRLFRVLRILKMLRQAPQLRIVVESMFTSIPSLLYLLLVMLLLFYIYGVIGVLLFHTNDPRYFSDLGEAFLSLFRVMTADSWSQIMYVNVNGCNGEYSTADQHRCTDSESFGGLAVLYFVSFVLIAGLVLLSLMVAVVTCTMDSIATAISNEQQPEEHDPSEKEGLAREGVGEASDRHKELLQMLRELEDKIEQQTRDIVQLQEDLEQ